MANERRSSSLLRELACARFSDSRDVAKIKQAKRKEDARDLGKEGGGGGSRRDPVPSLSPAPLRVSPKPSYHYPTGALLSFSMQQAIRELKHLTGS